ncbi:MAG TPA: efflux RND transporter periplasmic adaptor subunit [Polyangiaceae bacterium]|nr:efflux RND transporter periplasmic adaptor subunit [Polyangiaceae bacterium]
MNRLVGATLVLLLSGCSEGSTPIVPEATAAARDQIHLGAQDPKLPFLKIEVVTESDTGPMLNLTGRVAFDEDHTQRVSSPIDGRATKLFIKPGDMVKAGQQLILLTSPDVGQLQSDAQKAAQDLSIAQKAVERAHKLQADGAVSEKEVAQAEADFRKAKATAAASGSQLAALGISPSDPAVTVALRSQIAGKVVDRSTLVGQEIRADATAPLVTISDLKNVWVLADVYEQDLNLVREGAAIAVTVPAYPDEKFPGVVAHVGDVVDPMSHTVKLRCNVANADERLKPDMFARVDLAHQSGAKSIAIPAKAVMSDSEHSRVIIDTGNGTFKSRVVSVGPEVDGMVRVLGGLKPGERIVTDGALFLKNEMDNQ